MVDTIKWIKCSDDGTCDVPEGFKGECHCKYVAKRKAAEAKAEEVKPKVKVEGRGK